MDLRSAIARIPLAGPWLGLRRDLRIRAVFDRVYKEHRWPGLDSKSGPGSSLPQTAFFRDCLVHLSNRLVHKALARIVQSRSTYLLTTTFPARTKNYNIPTGKWRPLNLCVAPFNLPRPTRVINEGNSDASYSDKSLCLWRISD